MTPSKRLPSKLSLRQLRNQATNLLRAIQAGEPDAIRRIGEFHPRFSDSFQAEIAAAEIVLADAQLVIARELGFDSWPRLKKHFDSLSHSATNMHRLVIEGNLQAVQEAVAQDPESVNEPNGSGLSPLTPPRFVTTGRQLTFCWSMERSLIFSPARFWARRPTPRFC